MTYESLSHSRFDCKYHLVLNGLIREPYCNVTALSQRIIIFSPIRYFIGRFFEFMAIFIDMFIGHDFAEETKMTGTIANRR